jgi:hypothetical protein
MNWKRETPKPAAGKKKNILAPPPSFTTRRFWQSTQGPSSCRECGETTTITVMVEPDEAQQIALAIQQGSIQLSLRSPEDGNVTVIPMIGIEALVR